MDRGCNAHSPCLELGKKSPCRNAEEESQIDFLLSSSSIHLEDCCVEQSLHFRSDHWPIVSNYVFGSPNYSDHERFKRCLVKWSPSEFWSHRVNEFSADWTDPLSAFGQWAQIARECRLPAGREVVFQDNLQDLLQLRRPTLGLRLASSGEPCNISNTQKTQTVYAVPSSQGSVRVWTCPTCAE